MLASDNDALGRGMRAARVPKSRWCEELQKALPQKKVGAVFQVLANHEELMKKWLRWSTYVVYKSSLVPSHLRQRNLALARTGWLANCEYAWLSYLNNGASNQKGGPADFSEADIRALEVGSTDSHWMSAQNDAKSNDAALDVAAIRAAEELRDDACVSDATWAALARGLSEHQCMDLIASIGHYSLNSMLLNSLGVPLDKFPIQTPGFQQSAGRHVGLACGPQPSAPRIRPVDAEVSPNLNGLKTLPRHPDMAKKLDIWMSFVRECDVPPRLKELAILRTVWLLNSGYEWHQHVRSARQAGFTDEDFKALELGPRDSRWSEAETLVLDVCDELRRKSCIGDANWSALEHLGFSLHQRMDLIATIGQFTSISLMLNSLGVQLEDPSITPRYPGFRPDVSA